MSIRPDRVVLVLGTGTDVGKTWLSARLVRHWRDAGHRVAARKPAQSFAPGDVERGITDAQLLAAASGEDPTDVCPAHRWYPVAMAPPMAADVLGLVPPATADLQRELVWPAPVDIGLVESAGGVRSPLATDGDSVTWCEAIAPDLTVLVADAGLGTINAVTLSVDALRDELGADVPLVVHLNRFDPASDLHHRNRHWLTDRLSVRTTTESEILACDGWKGMTSD